jgi:ferric enterobactin receptor
MIGANFTYSTGRPQTVPVNTFDISTLTYIFAFSERNQGRIPDYYRLDLSLTHETKPWYFKDYKVNYVFSIYNVLARKNAYSIFYQNVYGRPPSAYKLSILGSMFPSMSINFEF